MANYTVTLDAFCNLDYKQIGGKAANLTELQRIPEINVPRGFCVTSRAFLDFTSNLELSRGIENIPDLQEFSVAAKTRVKGKSLDASLIREINEKLGDYHEPLIVRSSATLEDSAKYSFAGQQDSYLNVSKERILEHVRECWASLYNVNALTYRRHMGINEIGAMSVIVQELVNAKASGVMMTAQLSTGNKNVVIIEASHGFGNVVVSGEVNPDFYCIDKKTGRLVRKKINRKGKMCILNDKRIEIVSLDSDYLSTASSLDDYEVLRLFNIGMKIEEHYQHPQDIEFAINNKINIVQSRPLQLRK